MAAIGRRRGGSVRGAALAGCVASVVAAPVGAAPAAAQEREINEIIRTRVEAVTAAGIPAILVEEDRVHSRTELPRFYESRGFQPAWVSDEGPGPAADSLLRALQRATREGLEPADYHLRRIRAIYSEARIARRARTTADRRRLAELDLLLTDGFLIYGAHLVGGVVNPVTIHPEWSAARREADLVALLDDALSSGRIAAALETLLPRHPGYFRLREALQRYRAVAADGGWGELPGVTLRPGSSGAAVAALRRRLVLGGDLVATGGAEDAYDADVEAAVRRFQARHGLTPDGIAGLESNAILNIPVETRIREIELNLERWRWLPRDLGERHILVNIAGFELDVVEGDSTVFTSRVMVGQRYRKTPVFSDRMSYLVLSPYWTIPPNILEQDKLPLIRQDPGRYLAENRIRVLAPDGRAVDPRTVDWARVTGRTNLRFRMEPGPENPLGRVKFMFPNPYHVYLHDTPGRELFGRANRAFSSGCIRVERSMELAEYLLRDDARWTPARIEAVANGGTEQTIQLRRPLPVHLLYWTVWAERDGTVQFRPDVYERDQALDAALRDPPPAADG